MSEQPPARVEYDGPLATIVIDHPPLNLFGEPLLRSLEAAIGEVEGSDARALMVRAEGNVFTGGADVNGFAGRTAEEGEEFFGQGFEMTHRIERLPMPTV